MKTRMIYLFLINLAIASFASCQNNGLSDLRQIQGFPNKVGDSWSYLVTDTAYAYGKHQGTNQTTDTLSVSVIGSTHLPDGTQAAIWRTAWPPELAFSSPPWNVDTTYVWISADTVNMSSGMEPVLHPPKSMKDIPITSKFIFPVQTGQTWNIGPDSSRVVSVSSLQVPAGTFDNVYQILRNESSFNFYLTEHDWLKPGVGLVQRMVAFNGTFYTWKLISYHVK